MFSFPSPERGRVDIGGLRPPSIEKDADAKYRLCEVRIRVGVIAVIEPTPTRPPSLRDAGRPPPYRGM
jgi:hypothetical protein